MFAIVNLSRCVPIVICPFLERSSVITKVQCFVESLQNSISRFQAHRVVLASCSDYFRAMFTDAMRESRQSEICLNGVSAAGMRLLLDYAYTSRLALNLANIQDVLSAASHIQVVAVVEACSTYLQVTYALLVNLSHCSQEYYCNVTVCRYLCHK